MQREDAKSTPIVALTANAYAEDISNAMAAGMNAHLAKPIEPAQMVATIAQVFAAS
ncbi:MAG: response regulator [Clostridia bacterium]